MTHIPLGELLPEGIQYFMFKSVFAKYVTTFMALLLVSFLLLLFIVNSVIRNYSIRAEQKNVRGVALSCAEDLGEMFGNSGLTDFGDYIREGTSADTSSEGYIERLLDAVMTNFEDMSIYVTDSNGGFIFSTGKAYGITIPEGTPILNEEYFTAMDGTSAESAGKSADSTSPSIPAPGASESDEDSLPGVFLQIDSRKNDGLRLAYAAPVTVGNGTYVGHVIVTSTAEAWTTLMNDTLRSVIVAALWILLAALIAIYFTTERVIGPLREMSRAAKKLMVGQYDVRVRVHGKDEVAELAVAFNQMTQALDNLERMRNSFVANVSHDLRTPMTTISGFIDGILDGVIPPDQHTHYLQVVSDEVRRLSRLVTALLDVSRLQAGDRKFDMKPFDICEMGRQILISFEQKIDSKKLGVEFECEDERMFVLADRDAIHQILYNICDNAVKFSYEGGKLRMSFSWSENEFSRERKAMIRVFNEGQGIPAEDIPFVFERFYKGDKSRSLDKSGVGLGMFISKTIIEAHRETITVSSEHGKNCEFIFTLARTEPPVSKGRAMYTQGGNP